MNPDDLPTCGYYASRLDPNNAPLRRVVPWAGAALVIAVLVTVGLYLWSGTRERQQEGQAATLEFVGSRDLQNDAPATLWLRIRNTGRKPIHRLRLHVGADLLRACQLISLKPTYRGHTFSRQDDMHCYDFGPLRAGDTLRVELMVQPRPEAGFSRVRWDAKACGDDGVVLASRTNVMQIVP